MKRKQSTIEGVIVPMVTPVTGGGEIDFDGLVQIANWLVESGVDGLFLAGTTGRFSHFTPEQNRDICSVVAKAVGDRVTIYGGASDSGLHRIVHNANLMKEAGAHFAVTTPPYYLSYSVQEVEDVLRKVADLSPLPVVYYSIPQFVGYGLRPEFLAEMADHPNVAGYKDSTNDLAHHVDVLQRTEGKTFDVLIGKDKLLTDALKAGSKGLVVSFANVYPKLYVDLVQAAKQGDWRQVESLQTEVTRILEDYYSASKLNGQPAFSSLLYFMQDKFRAQGINVTLV